MPTYKAGDVICESLPYVHVVDEEFKGKRCDYCLCESASLKKCAKCMSMVYCSRECQVEDWKQSHKFKECELLALTATEKPPKVLETVQRHKYLFLVRFLLKNRYKPPTQFTLYDGRIRRISDLVDHYRESSEIAENRDEFNAIIKHVHQLLKRIDYDLSLPIVARSYAQLVVNSFGIRDPILAISFATGLYIESSVFDHSCLPSAHRIFSGNRIQVRALRDIPANEAPTVTYIDVMQPRDARRKLLSSSWFFECRCIVCANDLDRGFDYRRYQSLRNSVSDPSLEEFSRFEKFSEMYNMETRLLGKYNLLATSNLSNMFFTIVRSIPEDKNELSLWKIKVKGLEFELNENLSITHGNSKFTEKLNEIKLKIYTELRNSYNIDLF